MDGFAYPNEAQIDWSLIVVLYPFTTGLIAGVFIVSALYYVFNVQSLKSLARFSLVTALAFVIVAPLPLAIHLGRPDRALEIFLTPHFTSAMAMFGYIWIFYMGILMIQTWLVFRKDIVAYALGHRPQAACLLGYGPGCVRPVAKVAGHRPAAGEVPGRHRHPLGLDPVPWLLWLHIRLSKG